MKPSQEFLDDVARRWNDKQSMSAIADAKGVSKGVIAGTIHRMREAGAKLDIRGVVRLSKANAARKAKKAASSRKTKRAETDAIAAAIDAQPAPREKPVPVSAARSVPLARVRIKQRALEPGVVPVVPRPALAAPVAMPVRVPVVALAPGGCHFIDGHPVEEMRAGKDPFCGKKRAPGSPYCERHHAICYRPAKERPVAEFATVYIPKAHH